MSWALASPWLALWVRDAPVLTAGDWPMAVAYSLIAFVCSLLGFVAFRVRESMTHFFSVHDALNLAKAVLFAEVATCLILFSATRLDGVPRTTPVIHGLLLAAGLVGARAIVRLGYAERRPPSAERAAAIGHIIVVGSTRLSALYIGLLKACANRHNQVAAILDDRPEMIGRSIEGVRILGPVSELDALIREFSEHGVSIDRIIIGSDAADLDPKQAQEISDTAAKHRIRIDFVPRLLGVDAFETPIAPASEDEAPPQASSHYFKAKRYLDIALSLLLITALAPLFLIVSVLVLLDVGQPIFFWQRRNGLNGRIFQLYKFRTLRPACDDEATARNRHSWIGAVLRRTRLDELPQLLNVVVGDMSLIGPRPLLFRDQPEKPSLRLSVRPGISGWAQINGGTLLNVDEKSALDDWYVRNASPALDFKIAILTIGFLIGGSENRKRRAQWVPRDADIPRRPQPQQ